MTFASNATQVPQKSARPKFRLGLGLGIAAFVSIVLWAGFARLAQTFLG